MAKSSNNLLGLPEIGPPAIPPAGVNSAGKVADEVKIHAADAEIGLATPAHRHAIAPWPLIDRYPVIVGSGLSMAYAASVFRLALTGYRREFVDALDEILERDPHLFAVLTQRVLTVCGARIVVTPKDRESKKCRKIAEEVERQIGNIAEFRKALVGLVFSGLYYGIGACAVSWNAKRDSGISGWEAERLHFIHSRRLNYPNPGDWDLRVWDQGQMYPWSSGNADVGPTARLFGVPVANYPGQFLVFSPQVRADYPTREGLGRQVALWSVLKTMGARSAAQFVERFAKPWAIATFTTTSNGKPRAAEGGGGNSDVAAANNALRALGTGSLAGAVIPDSVKIELQQVEAGSNSLGYKDWIELCDKQISKGVLGQADTTESGDNGGRAAVETRKSGTDQLSRFDALMIADMLQEQLVDWIVRLNFPNDFDKRPRITLVVDPDPDPMAVMKLIDLGSKAGMPIDADKAALKVGLDLVDPQDPDARRLSPVLPVDPSTLRTKSEREADIQENGGVDPHAPEAPPAAGTAPPGSAAAGEPAPKKGEAPPKATQKKAPPGAAPPAKKPPPKKAAPPKKDATSSEDEE